MICFLKTFFHELNRANILYSVLRNGRELPGDFGRDIDLFVHKEALTIFEKILYKVSELQNFTILKTITRSNYKAYYLQKQNDFFSPIIPIDVWTKVEWKSFEYLGVEDLLDAKGVDIIPEGIRHASKALECYVNLIKRLVQYGNVKPKYQQSIVEAARLDPYFKYLCEKNLSAKLSFKIMNKLKDGDWDGLNLLAKRVKITLIYQKAIKTFGVGVFFGLAKFLLGWISQFRAQKGAFISFIGADGSGKTTLIEQFYKNQLTMPYPNIVYRHGRFKIIPDLKTFIGRKKKNKINRKSIVAQLDANQDIEAFSSMPQRQFGEFRSLLYMMYYLFDFVLGYGFVYIQKGIGNIVLFDRYYYDYMILKEYEMLPNWIKTFLIQLVPKPDIVAYPKADAELIFNRKPELTVNEIKRQQRACNKVSEVIDTVKVINSKDGAEIAFNELLESLYWKNNEYISC